MSEPSMAGAADSLRPEMDQPKQSAGGGLATWLEGTGAAVLALLGLLAVSLYLRTSALDASFWMDEGLSVGIASHDLTSIPHALRNDGSPPLYYMLLSVWMGVFGRTEEATHALSLVAALLTIPAGMWVGGSLFGRRAGLMLAALCSFNAFLTVYGEETRMYALMALLALLATGCFIHGFVLRRRRYLVGFAVLEALMLYTHGWAIFFGIACALALIPILLRSDDRKGILIDALIAFGGAGVLFLPWLPTLMHQSAHTAAPWALKPRFGAVKQISQGMMGGDRVTVALAFAAIAGLLAIIFPRRRFATIAWNGGDRQGPLGGERLRTALISLLVIAFGTLAVAWLVSQINPAWVLRYMAVVVGPLLLIASVGASRSGWIGIGGVIAACILSLGLGINGDLLNKSNVRNIATEVRGDMRPGDLVVVGQPEQTPLAWYYLPGGMRFADLIGRTSDPRMLDWTDVTDRLRAADPTVTYNRLITGMPVGSRVIFIRPLTVGRTNWSAPWTSLIRARSAKWGQLFEADPRLQKVKAAPWFYLPASTVADTAVLYRKVKSGT